MRAEGLPGGRCRGAAGYAEAVILQEHHDAPAEQVERRVELRMLRQEILYRPNAPLLWVVLDETTLHRRYGGRQVLRAQIQHLIALTELQNVIVQVMTFDQGGYDAADGPVAILRFAEAHVHDVVYRERARSASYPADPAIVDYYCVALDRLTVRAHEPHATQAILYQRLKDL